MQQFGQILTIVGLTTAVVGLLLSFGVKIPLLGRLPGDIYIERGNFKLYFPIATSIVLSLSFTLIMNIFKK